MERASLRWVLIDAQLHVESALDLCHGARHVQQSAIGMRRPSSPNRLLSRNRLLPDNPVPLDQIVRRTAPPSDNDDNWDWQGHKSAGANWRELPDCATAVRWLNRASWRQPNARPAESLLLPPGHGPARPAVVPARIRRHLGQQRETEQQYRETMNRFQEAQAIVEFFTISSA